MSSFGYFWVSDPRLPASISPHPTGHMTKGEQHKDTKVSSVVTPGSDKCQDYTSNLQD